MSPEIHVERKTHLDTSLGENLVFVLIFFLICHWMGSEIIRLEPHQLPKL